MEHLNEYASVLPVALNNAVEIMELSHKGQRSYWLLVILCEKNFDFKRFTAKDVHKYSPLTRSDSLYLQLDVLERSGLLKSYANESTNNFRTIEAKKWKLTERARDFYLIFKRECNALLSCEAITKLQQTASA